MSLRSDYESAQAEYLRVNEEVRQAQQEGQTVPDELTRRKNEAIVKSQGTYKLWQANNFFDDG